MMCLEKYTRLIIDLQYSWSFIVRDVNVEKTLGRVWVDVYSICLGRDVRIWSTITSLSKWWVKNKRIDIGLYASNCKGCEVFQWNLLCQIGAIDRDLGSWNKKRFCYFCQLQIGKMYRNKTLLWRCRPYGIQMVQRHWILTLSKGGYPFSGWWWPLCLCGSSI